MARPVNDPTSTLNPNVRGMGQSATVAINQHSNELLAQGREVFKLGLGQSPFPVPDSVVEALRENAHQKAYLDVAGLRELRETVAAYHHRASGCAAGGEDVLVGPGSKELMFLLQLAYDGDLLIPSPAWVSYVPQARIIGRRVRTIHTDASSRWNISAAQLEAHCADEPERPRILILNYPNNPTGLTYTTEELEALARVAQRHGVVLLSDEIYGETHHRGLHESIARWYPEGTIISSGLSKWCGAGGWRLGTFTFPEQLRWLRQAMTSVASETYTSTSAPIQYAAVRAFRGGADIEAYLEASRKVLAALGNRIASRLNDAEIATHPPEGGFYLFPDFGSLREPLLRRGIGDSAELCRRALGETGVAFLPGSDFGRPVEELTARLAYVDFDGGAALEGVSRLGPDDTITAGFLQEYCPRVTTAVERLCDWAVAPG